MTVNTTRLAIPKPQLGDAADIEVATHPALDKIDSTAAAWASGTIAARPAAGTMVGRFYWATDTRIAYLDVGATWVQITPGPGTLEPTFRSTADPDYVMADGALRSKTGQYAPLFAAIGHVGNGGADPGGGNFKIPDVQGRMLVGKGSHAEVNSLVNNDGLAVGSRKVKHRHGRGSLSIDGNGSHRHVERAYWEAWQVYVQGGGLRAVGQLGWGDSSDWMQDAGFHGHGTSGEIGDTAGPLDGSGYQVCNYQIRY